MARHNSFANSFTLIILAFLGYFSLLTLATPATPYNSPAYAPLQNLEASTDFIPVLNASALGNSSDSASLQNVSAPVTATYVVYSGNNSAQTTQLRNAIYSIMSLWAIREIGSPDDYLGIEFWIVKMNSYQRLALLKIVPGVIMTFSSF